MLDVGRGKGDVLIRLAERSQITGVRIGAHHAFGELDDVLRALVLLTRPGGLALVGAGFWEKEPTRAYFHALGVPPFHQNDHVGNIVAAEALELRPLYSAVSSRDEWDAFEWLYRYSLEQHRHAHGPTPDQEDELTRRHQYLTAQLRHGRDTMGFALYMFRRPTDSETQTATGRCGVPMGSGRYTVASAPTPRRARTPMCATPPRSAARARRPAEVRTPRPSA